MKRKLFSRIILSVNGINVNAPHINATNFQVQGTKGNGQISTGDGFGMEIKKAIKLPLDVALLKLMMSFNSEEDIDFKKVEEFKVDSGESWGAIIATLEELKKKEKAKKRIEMIDSMLRKLREKARKDNSLNFSESQIQMLINHQ